MGQSTRYKEHVSLLNIISVRVNISSELFNNKNITFIGFDTSDLNVVIFDMGLSKYSVKRKYCKINIFDVCLK